MGTITDRVAHYLLNRLRRQAISEVYDMAEAAGLLKSTFVFEEDENSGVVWRTTELARSPMTDDPAQNRAIIARRLRAHGCNVDGVLQTNRIEPKTARSVRAKPDGGGEGPDPSTGGSQQPTAGNGPVPHDLEVLRLVREFAAPPAVADAALAMLLAHAISESVPRLERLFAVLRQPNPFIVVKIPTRGLEKHLDRQLERGRILPVKLSTIEGFTSFLPEGTLRSSRRPRFSVATFFGTDIAEKSASLTTKSLTLAAMSPKLPTLIIDETDAELHPMTSGADLVIRGSGVDATILIELMDVCCGIQPMDAWTFIKSSAVDFTQVGLDDLTLALRPGRTVSQILAVLEALTRHRLEERRTEQEHASDSKSKSKTGGGKKATGPSFERIEPASTNGGGEGATAAVASVLCVESLSGYGSAQEWAADLRSDLPLWAKGEFQWSEMSTRLLLSGPPGTGKTTFAKALCNSLQVPLLATSVGRWLEPGYLGDVLTAMTTTFEAAKGAAPSILFIDEADNIGRRSANSRDYGDYWDSIVNRLLELLDGATKADGVIILAATNAPEKIDPALLRSGRLERHIVIPPPDREALAGILRHHLASDLNTVLASRPSKSSGPVGGTTTWSRITPAVFSEAQSTHSDSQELKA